MDFFDDLVRLETSLWNTIERRLASEGRIGLATLQALQVVHRHGGDARVHELSHDLGITIGAASKLADRLERDGLIARRPNPDDRRSSLLSLTARADILRREAAVVSDEVVNRLVEDGEDGEDVGALSGAIRRLQARLGEVAEVRS
jgi:MarR family multiple antibiotic resistance transcriptional regulator